MADIYGMQRRWDHLGDEKPRCSNPDCNALLAELVTRPWRVRCRRCKTITVADGSRQWPYELAVTAAWSGRGVNIAEL